jgi:hypothetical protein
MIAQAKEGAILMGSSGVVSIANDYSGNTPSVHLRIGHIIDCSAG